MADDAQFQINLVTPERILLSGMATEVMLRTGEGDATFLAGHTPLVGSVKPGVVRVVRPEGEVIRVAVHGGFTQVELDVPVEAEGAAEGATGTRVTLLAAVAELAEEIDTDRARAALVAAEAKVAELGGTGRTVAEDEVADPELVEAEAAVLRAQVRLETVEAASTTATA